MQSYYKFLRVLLAFVFIIQMSTASMSNVLAAPSNTGEGIAFAPSQVAPPLQQAMKIGTVIHKGARNSIVTGNPTLRNDPTGKWSYMRIGARKAVNGNTSFVEIGWLKGAQPESGGFPRSYWVIRDANCIVGQCNPPVGWGGYPQIGIGYNYQIKKTASLTWSVYFNNLNVPLQTLWVGWNKTNDVNSGGETPNLNQGMGDSNNNNNSYFDGTNWWGLCNTVPSITDPKYHVDPGANCSSWRVYGGN